MLRKRKANELYRRLRYTFAGKVNKEQASTRNPLKFETLEQFDIQSTDFSEIDYSSPEHKDLLQYVYTFVFANPEPIDNIKLYTANSNKKEVVISGSKNSQKITFA